MKRTAEALADTSDLLTTVSLSQLPENETEGNENAHESAHGWVVPEFTESSMKQGAAADCCGGSDPAYNSLLDSLIDGGNGVSDFITDNPRTYATLRTFTVGVFYSRLHPDDRAKRDAEFRLAFELIMAWLFRLLNAKCWVLPIVLLSLWAWKSILPKPFWKLLCSLRLLYAKSTTEMIATDLGYRALRQAHLSSPKVSFSVMDNCLVKFNTSFEGRPGEGSVPYLMINWFTLPIPAVEAESSTFVSVSGFVVSPAFFVNDIDNDTFFYNYISVHKDIWTGSGNDIVTAQWLTDAAAISAHLKLDCAFFLELAVAGSPMDILNHPTDIDKPKKSILLYQPHVPTLNGTAGYADVRKWWEMLLLCHAALGIWCHLVIGDQQSYSRMVWLMRKEPQSYSSLVPFPGDFHFIVHMLMAIHILWWTPLISWLVTTAEICVQSTTEEWSSVELYNRYRFLYETLIVGILAYVVEVVPSYLLEQPDLLLTMASERNRGELFGFMIN